MTKRIGFKPAKAAAWREFSLYIRKRDSIRTTGREGEARCVTCGKVYASSGQGCLQAGHFIPGRHLSILFDERNCHAQCYNCNIRLKGNWPEYYAYMLARYGSRVIEELMAKNRQTVSMMPHELLALAESFRAKRLELEAGP